MSSDNQVIKICVKNQDNEEIIFKIKKTTELSKLMDRYLSRVGISKKGATFLYSGERVKSENTPEQLGMADGDVIECVINQAGG